MSISGADCRLSKGWAAAVLGSTRARTRLEAAEFVRTIEMRQGLKTARGRCSPCDRVLQAFDALKKPTAPIAEV
jgi:hypothetical protein